MTENVDSYKEEKPQEVTAQAETTTTTLEQQAEAQEDAKTLVETTIQPKLDGLKTEILNDAARTNEAIHERFNLDIPSYEKNKLTIEGMAQIEANQWKRYEYLPVMIASAPDVAAWSWETLKFSVNAFKFSAYTNVNTGWTWDGNGWIIGLEKQRNAFRASGNLILLWWEQDNWKDYYKNNAVFGVGYVGVGTPAWKLLSGHLDVWWWYWASAVEGKVGWKKIDTTTWIPVIAVKSWWDVALIRESLRLKLEAGGVFPVGPKSDLYDWTKGNGVWWTGFWGLKSDAFFIVAVGLAIRIE